MEFVPYTLKWIELILRWGHVLFSILWVGNSFLFNYLDNKLNKDITNEDRKIPIKQMLRDEALKAFEIWNKKTDKVEY